MANGPDDLVEFTLAEIALCGVQGAGSADFRRFIQSFHKENSSQTARSAPGAETSSGGFTRRYYEKIWGWLLEHPDVRIVYQNEPRKLRLAEFEALELQETGSNGADYIAEHQSENAGGADGPSTEPLSAPVSKPSFRAALQKRLLDRRQSSRNGTRHPESPREPANTGLTAQRDQTKGNNKIRWPSTGGISQEPVFDDVPASLTAPRIFVSQNRTWQAVAGHPVDFKRLSALQFELLSIIAAHGANGIGQPDLVRASGQDKRSVPKRTDELAKAGYIEKTPISYTGVRTSLCIHKRFVRAGHFLKNPNDLQDVFRNRTVILSSLVNLLYEILKKEPVLPYHQLRDRLGVDFDQFNTRGIRSSVRRLEQTGFLEKKRILKGQNSRDTVVVIKLLRPPNEEDVKYINYRRKAPRDDAEGFVVEDEDGDDLMKDLELDLDLDDDAGDAENSRIPPQWSPDRLFGNLAFDAIDMAGPDGIDASEVRDKTMGKFWKRPTESFISRLTDNWETSQPPHLRHLAIVRDTAVTNEKKLLHYIYRTHGNFQKAVDIGAAAWEVVSREAMKKNSTEKRGRPEKHDHEKTLNQWGFHDVNLNDFQQKNGLRGASSLAECNSAVKKARKHGPRWDNGLTQDLGIKKHSRPPGNKGRKKAAESTPSIASTPAQTPMATPTSQKSKQLPTETPEQPEQIVQSSPCPDQGSAMKRAPKGVRRSKQLAVPLLSAEQREALNLPPRGRLGAFIEDQIRAHREKVGDPSALPEVLYTDPANMPGHVKSKEKKPRKKATESKLFTKAFRRKHNLPENGKLHQNIIDHFRQLEREGKLESTLEPTTDAPSTPAPLDPKPTVVDEAVGNHEASPHAGIKRKADVIPTPEESPKRLHMEADSHSDPLAEQIPTILSTRTTLNVSVPVAPMLITTPGTSVASQTPTSPELPTVQAVPITKPGLHATEARNVQVVTNELTPMADETGAQNRRKPSTSKTPNRPPRLGLKPDFPDSPDIAMTNLETPNRPVLLAGPKADDDTASGKAKQKALEPRLQALLGQFEHRSAPGVYFDPTATRSVPRGRPRKAFLAVFRSDKLVEQEWFKPEPESTRMCISPKATRTPRATQKLKSTPRPSGRYTAEINANALGNPTPQTPASVGTTRSSFAGPARRNVKRVDHATGEQLQKIRLPSEVIPEVELNEHEIVQDDRNSTLEKRSNKSDVEVFTSDVPLQNGGPEGHMQGFTSKFPSIATNQHFAEDATEEPARPIISVRSQGGWTAVNSYQSPYASVDSCPHIVDRWTTVNSPAISQQSGRSTHTDATAADDDDYQPDGDTAEHTSAPQTLVKLQELGKRGVVLGQGYVWRLRTEIVSEIIDLCGGIFPFNGEIIEPFYKIWQERAPNMPTPDRTTVSNTINRMLKVRELGLWKLTFPVSTLEGARKTVDKHIIGRKDVAKDDPRVENLKEGIAKAYPKKFFPLEVRHLAGPEPVQRKPIEAEFDDSITFEGVRPSADQKLDQRILAAKHDRKKSMAEKKKLHVQGNNRRPAIRSTTAGKARPRRLETITPGKPRRKKNVLEIVFDDSNSSSDESDTMPEIMTGIEPSGKHSDGFVNLSPAGWLYNLHDAEKALLAPVVHFHEINGTFSTHFGSASISKAAIRPKSRASKPTAPLQFKFIMVENPSSRKRKQVQFADENTANKKRRLSGKMQSTTAGSAYRDQYERFAPPTLVERLSGRTGNPNDPIYVPPKKKNYKSKAKAWMPVEPGRGKARKAKREAAEREVAESVDPALKFKKVFCTLTIATCMSAEEDGIDWSIVEKASSKEPGYSLEKTKKLWLWIQTHMAPQLKVSKDRFQAAFLQAYENGKVPSIERPETYDWATLVRWALRNCEQPELPLPLKAEALRGYVVEESRHKAFDRQAWSQKPMTHVLRAQRLLKYAYAMPINDDSAESITDENMRARSWIRANIATAPRLYSSIVAHDKLSKLGNSTLQPIVNDLVKERLIRQRKVKRLLPGRNFDFAPKAAAKYRCLYDQEVYMEAVRFKKSMDAAFLHESPALRYVTVSKTAPNGAIMALLPLFSEGQVQLVPVLPPINNELGAPPPRLSIWGFMEGDYVHRKIDRKRLFWDIRVIPTDKYKFGNPLPPSSKATGEGSPMTWQPLPAPPLPGKDDDNAVLPIWSSLDGEYVTWSWWYRILHLVLQSLMFQPGLFAAELHRQLAPGAAELFEVEMVLKWLVECGAAKKSEEGSYTATGGFWAAFGESLHEDRDDWFGDHVKRSKHTQGIRQPWKLQYNVVSQRVSAILHGEGHDGSMYVGRGDEHEGEGNDEDNAVLPFAFNTTSTLEERVENSKAQQLQSYGDDGDVEMADADGATG